MPNYSLLFARTHALADDSARAWGWDKVDDLRNEYRRPDNGERARFVIDQPGAIQGLRWLTRAYFGHEWEKRADAAALLVMAEQGFFKVISGAMPPPRAPRRRREEHLMSELKSLLRGDLR